MVKIANRSCFLAGALVTLVLWSGNAFAITFTPGHFYGSHYNKYGISEYDSTGKFLGHLSTAPVPTRGIAFGPDKLLYFAFPDGGGFAVKAMESDGAVQQPYSFPERQIAGSSFAGKITFDGAHFYVQGVRFTVGIPNSAEPVLPFGIIDVAPLPSGNLLAIDAHQLNEYSPEGCPNR